MADWPSTKDENSPSLPFKKGRLGGFESYFLHNNMGFVRRGSESEWSKTSLSGLEVEGEADPGSGCKRAMGLILRIP